MSRCVDELAAQCSLVIVPPANMVSRAQSDCMLWWRYSDVKTQQSNVDDSPHAVCDRVRRAQYAGMTA